MSAGYITFGVILLLLWLVVCFLLIRQTRRLSLDRYEVIPYVFFPLKALICVNCILAAVNTGVVSNIWWFANLNAASLGVATSVLQHGIFRPIVLFGTCHLLHSSLSDLVKTEEPGSGSCSCSRADSTVTPQSNSAVANQAPSNMTTPRFDRDSVDLPPATRGEIDNDTAIEPHGRNPTAPGNGGGFTSLRRRSREELAMNSDDSRPASADQPSSGSNSARGKPPPAPVPPLALNRRDGPYQSLDDPGHHAHAVYGRSGGVATFGGVDGTSIQISGYGFDSPRSPGADNISQLTAGSSQWFIPARKTLIRRSKPWALSVVFFLVLFIIFAALEAVELRQVGGLVSCEQLPGAFNADLESCISEMGGGRQKHILPRVFDVLTFLFTCIITAMWCRIGYLHSRRLLHRTARLRFYHLLIAVITLLVGSSLMCLLKFFDFARHGWPHATIEFMQNLLDMALYLCIVWRMVGLV